MEGLAQKTLLRLAALCAKAEYCSQEMRERLARQSMLTPEEREAILQRLLDDGYVDDRRYAAAYVRTKILYDHWGRRKIAYMLAGVKKIPSAVIQQAMAEVSDEQYRRSAMEVLEPRVRGIDVRDWEQRQRLIRSLTSRGYEPQLLSSLLDEIATR